MVILGSTGSIGINALKVAKQFGLEIEALACGSNITLLNQQIQCFQPKFVAIHNESLFHLLESRDCKVFVGEQGICEMLAQCHSKRIVNAVVGYAGLCFSLKILDLKKDLILANKESLVIAGKLLQQTILAQKNDKKELQKKVAINHHSGNRDSKHHTLLQRIFPIDSEHFSLYTLLHQELLPSDSCRTQLRKDFTNLYITASGGALRDTAIEKIPNARLCDVLKHPTWNMGEKITIDSATLVNKLYETLEAYWLFNTTQIHALIEKSSMVHAFVEFQDGSINASISHADMRLPIAYGLDVQKAKQKFSIQKLTLKELTKICFQEIDTNRYPLWNYKELLLQKPHLGIVLNASNELLQDLFLQEKIPFPLFAEIIAQVLLGLQDTTSPCNLHEILELRQESITLSNFFLKQTMKH